MKLFQRLDECPNSDLTFFIDRDPDYFKAVINYLCTQGINQLSREINLDGLAEEAEFFEIPDLQQKIKDKIEANKEKPVIKSDATKEENLEKLLDLLVQSKEISQQEVELLKKLLEKKEEEVKELKKIVEQKAEEVEQMKDLLEKKRDLMEFFVKNMG